MPSTSARPARSNSAFLRSRRLARAAGRCSRRSGTPPSRRPISGRGSSAAQAPPAPASRRRSGVTDHQQPEVERRVDHHGDQQAPAEDVEHRQEEAHHAGENDAANALIQVAEAKDRGRGQHRTDLPRPGAKSRSGRAGIPERPAPPRSQRRRRPRQTANALAWTREEAARPSGARALAGGRLCSEARDRHRQSRRNPARATVATVHSRAHDPRASGGTEPSRQTARTARTKPSWAASTRR